MSGGYPNLAGQVGPSQKVLRASRDATGRVGSGHKVSTSRYTEQVTLTRPDP